MSVSSTYMFLRDSDIALNKAIYRIPGCWGEEKTKKGVHELRKGGGFEDGHYLIITRNICLNNWLLTSRRREMIYFKKWRSI